jgi:hypothetical protein
MHPFLLTSSPVKELVAASASQLSHAQPQTVPPAAAALYSPLWLAGSLYGLSKLSPLLGHGSPLLLLQVSWYSTVLPYPRNFFSLSTVVLVCLQKLLSTL